MVEGPGATRNGRKVQPAVGLVLKELSIQQPCYGKSNSNINSNNNGGSSHSDNINGNTNTNGDTTLATKYRLKGRRLESAFSVGKEVFLVLGPVLPPVRRDADMENTPTSTNANANMHPTNETQGSSSINSSKCSDEIANKPMALRLHFGMNGCLALRKQQLLLGSNKSITMKAALAPWQRKDNKSSSQMCTLRFGNGQEEGAPPPVGSSSTIVVIEMTASTSCTVVSATVAASKLARLQNKDVCGDGTIFEPLAVLESILEKKKRSASVMVCDALLDQERFPGVGNIIKIEGLHRAGVHPRRLVETLSRDELLTTILECRNYARGWLSTGRAPSKKVYNQTHCLSCKHGRVKMVKMGNDLRRVTFWCERCQPSAVARSASTSTLCNDTSTKQEPPANNSNINSNGNNSISEQPTMAALHPRRCCPQHGSKRVMLRRVRNMSSPNLHRLFRTCGIRGCQYFSWADTHLPSCRCHPRGSSSKTVLKVSKTERTGGRWFLSCAVTNGSSSNSNTSSSSFSARNHQPLYPTPAQQFSNGCSFFQWATPGELAPLANDLSPLT